MVFKPTTLRVYLLRAREAGFDPDEILRGSGVTWNDVDSLKPFELDTIADLFHYIARATPPDFAMKCGYACSIRDFGIVGFSMMSMPSLRDAFEYYTRYSLLAGHPLVSTVVEDGNQWKMHFVPRRIMSTEALRFCLEVSIAGMEPVIRELTEQPAITTGIEFTFGKPSSDSRYGLFGTNVIRFGSKASAYCGHRTDLDRPIRSWDGEVSHLCYQQSDKFLAELTRSRSIREQLEDLMLISAGEMPSVDDMAKALRMSRRSLQRQLTNQSLSYQEIAKEFRMRHAIALLMEDRSNVKTIAFSLGFRDVSSFRRAFRIWTGLSIGEWKAANVVKDARCVKQRVVVNLDSMRAKVGYHHTTLRSPASFTGH
ncbi:helix-turn-helix domain-containing protein [Kineobactrum salinum]|uniref:AraC family transcriptional regulator n=1 Tax=Kineobactrum salinum TaxID=2708301 RepID=A0A6C0U4Q6_9GAMM|nr:AraC family transcriptional regulator [Kineobactrum salinum]QIB66833.1 AraC family transcriptional regulator [Kineobactrum salinum]